MTLRVLSLFSGAGGMDYGLHVAGLEVVGQCEIDAKARSVLKSHWPDVPLVEDVRDVRVCACRLGRVSDHPSRQSLHTDPPAVPGVRGDHPVEGGLDSTHEGARCDECGGFRAGAVDVVCGGFPCQDISIAGRRKGLDGDRSGLWWEFHRILGELRPRWGIIENVAGLLSSNGGRDLGAILGALGELGYGYAYRVLDAQYFGVAQRRRRVFVVASARATGAAEVLFEPEGGRGHLEAGHPSWEKAARRVDEGFDGGCRSTFIPMNERIGTMTTSWGGHYDSRQEVLSGAVQPGLLIQPATDTAGTLTATGAGAGGGPDDQTAQAGQLIPIEIVDPSDLRNQVGTLTSRDNHAQSRDADDQGFLIPVEHEDIALPDNVGTLTAGMEKNKMGAPEVDAGLYLPVAYSVTPEGGQGADLRAVETQKANTLTAIGQMHDRGVRIVTNLAVRRLTPVEAERLMGWPDDWTRWTADGTEVADSHRYRMCGNGVVGTVAAWIGSRIAWVDSLDQPAES